MNQPQDKLRIALVLEKMGYHITEYYNPAGILQTVYVDGKAMRMGEMVRLWRRG